MKTVWITTRFIGYHRWPDAPEEVAFLRIYHRHVFHVKLSVSVEGLNREVEFITLKRKVDFFITNEFKEQYFPYSCEQIASKLLFQFNAQSVEVSEDGENGATITKEE